MSSKTKPTATKEGARPALVPKLRFPDFREAKEWEEKRLGQLGQLIAGLTYSPDDVRESGLLVLRSSNVQNGEIALDDNVYVDPAVRGANLSQPNDILICVRNGSKALIGKNALIPEGMPLCTHGAFMTVFRAQTPKFVFQLFQTSRYQKQVAGDLGATINSINGGQFLKYKFVVPQPDEQQKIAECLSSVDELIAAQARKLDALKTHKKGLMQQLFPREGETQPRLRFPEFQNAGEWTSAPLGQLLTSSPDYGVNAAAVPFAEHLPKYLRITDISEEGRYLPEKQVSVDLEATDGNYLDEGDIVLTRTGASVGKSYQYRREDGRLVFAGFLIRVKPHPTKLVSTYLANFLTTGQFWKWVAVNSARSGQPGINSTEYSSLTIPLPPTRPEQQRIADCLSSLDDLIAAQTQTLEALKTHKQGLMQQLFPSPAEVAV